MSWKTAYTSMYYEGEPPPADLDLVASETALLVIDIQDVYMSRPERATLSGAALAHYDRWTPFHERFQGQVIPRTAALLELCRKTGITCMFARIGGHRRDGRDRSLSQKLPGFNNVLLPKDEPASQIVAALAPIDDEIVVHKTTDSALTGTNLRLILTNMAIRNVICCGIFTDQCVSSTVRSLADESFRVVVVEDCCAAGTDDLHHRELEIINRIYCNVMTSAELPAMIRPA